MEQNDVKPSSRQHYEASRNSAVALITSARGRAVGVTTARAVVRPGFCRLRQIQERTLFDLDQQFADRVQVVLARSKSNSTSDPAIAADCDFASSTAVISHFSASNWVASFSGMVAVHVAGERRVFLAEVDRQIGRVVPGLSGSASHSAQRPSPERNRHTTSAAPGRGHPCRCCAPRSVRVRSSCRTRTSFLRRCAAPSFGSGKPLNKSFSAISLTSNIPDPPQISSV